jgi:hypothetical protein
VAGKAREGGVELRRLGRDDDELGIVKLCRVGGGLQLRGEVVAARDAEAMLVERSGMLLAATEDGDVADAGEVPGLEAADHASADYANTVDSASTPRRASSRGSSFHSESGSSGSEKISRS